ncbi:MAG: DUF6035 family protein [Desulfococcaceae bacterium]
MKKPTIHQVIDIRTGEFVDADAFFSQPEDIIFQKRRELEECNKKNEKMLICPFCHQPVNIRGDKDGEKTMHFAHFPYSGDCYIKKSCNYTEEQIRAMKYNGVKESDRHKRLKYFIAECLENDKRFSDIRVDKQFKKGLSKEWRRPDVSAKFNNFDIAFEIQLSTTFLSVIIEREIFYHNNNTFIIWFFDGLRADVKSMRFSEKDILYSNNNNAFILNDKIIEDYRCTKTFSFLCYYQQFWIEDQQLKNEWITRKISFDNLIFDKDNYKLYYYDTKKIKQDLKFQLEYNTPWHQLWKNRFPLEWRNNEPDHVAYNDIVVNFRSSPISYDELKEKEILGNKQIWVVNTELYPIKLKSCINEYSKSINEEYRRKLFEINEKGKRDSEKISDKIKEYQGQIDYNISRQEDSNKEIEIYHKYQTDSKRIANELADKIIKKSYSYERFIGDFIRETTNEYGEKILEIHKKMCEENRNEKQILDKLEDIGNLNEKIIENSIYKCIPDDKINEFNRFWSKIRYARKEDVDKPQIDIFPTEYKKINNEDDFLYILFSQKDFYFYIYLQDEIEELKNNYTSINAEKREISKRYKYEIESISNKLIVHCDLKLEELSDRLHNISLEISEAENIIYMLNNKLEQVVNSQKMNIELLKQWRTEKIFDIKSKHKNEYIWEYESKDLTVWLTTNSDVYFDMGGNYLLYLFNPPIFKKISKDDFIAAISG